MTSRIRAEDVSSLLSVAMERLLACSGNSVGHCLIVSSSRGVLGLLLMNAHRKDRTVDTVYPINES